MTDRYTDPKRIPLFAEMGKLAAILTSQTASQISGNAARPVLKFVDHRWLLGRQHILSYKIVLALLQM
jgi:hypothetical protein